MFIMIRLNINSIEIKTQGGFVMYKINDFIEDAEKLGI